MDSGSTKDKVLDIVTQKMNVERDTISLDTKFGEDLGADSLDQAEIVMEIEDEFDICFPDEAESRVKTIGDSIKFVEELVKSKAH